MPTLEPAKWLLYLDGIHTPAERVDITFGAFSIPEASISLAPDVQVQRLGAEDRVQVAVFYLDTAQTANENVKPEYRLLFEGEITAWGYNNTPFGRAIQFTAVNHAAILQQLYTFFMTDVEGLAYGRYSSADMQNIPAAAPIFPAALFYEGLAREKAPIKRPYDLVENIFRALFEDAGENKYKSSVGAHFFARWCRRTNFVNRWAPSPLLEGQDQNANEGVFPVLKAFQQTTAVATLVGQAQSLANSSMWDLITGIFTRVYYEFTLLPNMPLVGFDLATRTILPYAAAKYTDKRNPIIAQLQAQITDTQVKIDGVNSNFVLIDRESTLADLQRQLTNLNLALSAAQADDADAKRGGGPANATQPLRLLNYVTKPQMQFCVPPRCNIIFPSLMTSFSYQENYAAQPTRLEVNDEFKKQALSQGNSAPAAITAAATTIGYPPRVQQALDGNPNLLLSGKNLLIFPEEFYKGPVVQRTKTPEWFFLMSGAIYAAADEAAKTDHANAELIHAEATRRLKEVEQAYGAFEYMKERASQKSGTGGMVFNPYVVPGFPGVIFDQQDSGLHLFCYITNVSHSLSSTGMSTNVGYSYAQTMEEFFEALVEQRVNQKPLPVGSLDAEAIKKAQADLAAAQTALDSVKQGKDTVAITKAQATLNAALNSPLLNQEANGYLAVLQAQQNLKDVLKKSGQASKEYKTAQDAVDAAQAVYDKAVAAQAEPDMAPESPILDVRVRLQSIDHAAEYFALLFDQGTNDAARPSAFDWRAAVGVRDGDSTAPLKFDRKSPTEIETNAIQDGPVTYALRDHFADIAKDYKQAIAYVARPICSLNEYIDFHGDLGIRQTKQPVGGEPGPTYFVKILDYTPGPGTEPVEDVAGNRSPALTEDMRKPWTERLLAYRNKVLSKTPLKG